MLLVLWAQSLLSQDPLLVPFFRVTNDDSTLIMIFNSNVLLGVNCWDFLWERLAGRFYVHCYWKFFETLILSQLFSASNHARSDLLMKNWKKINILQFTFTFSKRARIFSIVVTGSVHIMLFKAYIASDLIETASNTFSTCVVLQYFPSPLTSTSRDWNAESIVSPAPG